MRLTERHLDTLIEDTTSALSLLAGLSESFDTVERETTAFQSQCEVLLEDQKRLKKLENEVVNDLKYYSYLEPITRRLNAPGASRLVRDEGFVEMLTNLNNCIWFMSKHVSIHVLQLPLSVIWFVYTPSWPRFRFAPNNVNKATF